MIVVLERGEQRHDASWTNPLELGAANDCEQVEVTNRPRWSGSSSV
jgi:hypothetical protein